MKTYLVILGISTSLVYATCYWPDGSVRDDFVPCSSSKVCCKSGEACLSNGLCYGATLNFAYRGACTDKTWPESECPRVCYDGIFLLRANTSNTVTDNALYLEFPDTWANLFPCPNASKLFSCGPNTVCDDTVGQYRWVEGNVSVAQASYQPLPSTTVSTGSFKPTSTASSQANPSSMQTDTGTNTVALGAGLGVGLGVPLVAISALFVIFYIRAQRKLHPKETTREYHQEQSIHRHGAMETRKQTRDFVGELEGGRPELDG